jgi:VWFA-related protein
VVLYVDNENLHPHDRSRVLSQVRRYVSEIMQPHVRVMVVSAQRSVETVQPFTTDPRAVQDALRSMGRIAGGRVDAERQRGRIIHDLQEFSTAGNQRQVQAEARDLQERIRSYGEELAVDLDLSVTNLRSVLTTLAGVQGRKVMVHISSGLPAVPARDLVEWYGDLYQRASTLPLLARLNRRPLYNALASTANAQGVTFYTIDASGLGGDSGSSAEYGRPVDPAYSGIHAINLQEPLLTMADSTGGRALVGANDATVLLEELRDDLFTYYSLGHTLPTTGADTVHRVSVELDGHPELDVLYRRTLVEKSLETQVQDTVVSGLMLALDDNPMGLELDAGKPGPASDAHWMVPVEVSFPLESIALIPEADDYVGRVILFVANRDATGRQSDLQRRQFEIRMPPEDYETRRDEKYVVEFDLLLNPGLHRVVIGALDPVTRQASFVSLRRDVSRTSR